jgi:hypothetical protein
MKINLRQEIAMWVLGLPWTALAFFLVKESSDVATGVVMSFVLLVPIGLIVFSLRNRKQPT